MADPSGTSIKACDRAWQMRPFALVALLMAALYIASAARAQQASEELPSEPILRIETGLHVSIVRAIDADAKGRFAVTASDDKTVRVWSLPDGHPERVLRLPLGFGDNGKPRAVAISPDGRTIAVGGFTGIAGHYNIYLFDRETGAPTQRLTNLPNVIFYLAYSPDGKYLAASLGSDGIRVFDANLGYQPLPSDMKYTKASRSAMFDQSDRLVTASYDGFVRLYSANRYEAPVARSKVQCAALFRAVLSPDGARVAASCDHMKKVVVLSGLDLKQLFEPDTTGIDGSLAMVQWSKDGSLFAGGYANIANGVRRWRDGGKGAFVDIPIGNDTIMGMVATKSGAMLVASAYGFGLIDTNGNATALETNDSLGLNTGGGRKFVVSADGGVVQVDSVLPRHTYRFDMFKRQVEFDPPKNEALREAVTEAPALKVTDWFASRTPAVNGTPIKLKEENEYSLSLSVVPGTTHFVLGTTSRLYLLDAPGHELWPRSIPGPGEARYSNVTGDGRLVVVAYSDGTIRWLRLSDGTEQLALFMHPDGKRWIAWTPQGYYDASAGGDELIGWQVNRGHDQAPDFYKVAQFRGQFNRPGGRKSP
jgi:WD40 repeat protein